MERAELAAWLRLVLTPGLGDTSVRRLLAAFGLPGQIFLQDRIALSQVVTEAQALMLAQVPEGFERQLDATLTWLDGAPAERRIVVLGDAAYPPALLNIEDPPPMLYAQGVPWDGTGAAIAVVGSRNPTPQGRDNAQAFSRALAESGLTIVSGLALGVDGAAHEGALAGAPTGQLATIAVVGTGLDRVYPRRHLALAHRIAERGVLLSEYPIGTPPLAPNFPRRNRIIAALGQGTLVIEAALESGSLITARLAAEQGKEVFAVPGSIHSPQSRGCHALLRQGAKLVESAQDVLEELRIVPTAAVPPAAANPAAPAAVRDAPQVLAAMGFDPVGLDALIARTGMDAALLQARLLELELAGAVSRLPGGLFQRSASA
jgi:DNA processing protein